MHARWQWPLLAFVGLAWVCSPTAGSGPLGKVSAAEAAKDDSDKSVDLDSLIRGLSSGDVLQRSRSVDAIYGFGPKAQRAVPSLKRLLLDPGEEQGKNAAYAVLRVAGDRLDELFAELFGQLGSDDAREREAAVVALGRLGRAGSLGLRGRPVYTQSIEHVAARLGDADPSVRHAAAEALSDGFHSGKTLVDAVAPRLPTLWNDSDGRVRAAAAKLAARMLQTDLLPRLQILFKDEEPEVRRQAALSAGSLSKYLPSPNPRWIDKARSRGDKEALQRYERRRQAASAKAPPVIKGLIELAEDPVPEVRAAAISALGKEWGEFVAPAAAVLKAAIRDPHDDVRAAAAESLRVLGKKITPLLIQALEDDHFAARWNAIESLGEVHQTVGTARSSIVFSGRSGLYDDLDSEFLHDFRRYYHLLPRENSKQIAKRPVDPTTREAADALAKLLLVDNHNRQNDAADALDKFGPDARHAAPTIAKALASDDVYLRGKFLNVLQSIGPAARDQIPAIAEMIHKNPGAEYEAVRALEQIAPEPADAAMVIPILIHVLGVEYEGDAQRAAISLARRGKDAVPALTKALADGNWRRRRSAAFALAYLRKDARAAVPRLLKLLGDEEPDVAWNAVQALQHIAPNDPEVAKRLPEMLRHSDEGVRVKTAEAFATIGGNAAQQALPKVLDALSESPNAGTQILLLRAMQRIGLDATSADRLSRSPVEAGSRIVKDVLLALLDHPHAALNFLEKHPEALAKCPPDVILSTIEQEDQKSLPLRQAILESQHLPLEVMAWLGDSRFLPILQERAKRAGVHHRTYLVACAGACGAKPDRIVEISATNPGDFRPASATGVGDPRRMPGSFSGAHADGYTRICVTGRIIMPDGKHAKDVKFFNTNDRMLLGKRLNERAAVKYDSTTGRFVFFTVVYAAYTGGGKEPGPFQTGAARVRIEAEGAKPLEASFFDEMPEVLITLAEKDTDVTQAKSNR